jgi:hypothetical protein
MSARPQPKQEKIPIKDEQPANERDSETVDRIDRYFEVVSDFVQAVFDDPSLLDESPDGSNLVFVPENDPELADVNLQGAERMARAGHAVHVYHQRDWRRRRGQAQENTE